MIFYRIFQYIYLSKPLAGVERWYVINKVLRLYFPQIFYVGMIVFHSTKEI